MSFSGSMKRPYLRIGFLGDFICDRFVNIPDHNEEHTQAQVNELFHITVQILGDNPGVFRPFLLRTLPRFKPGSQRSRHRWEKRMQVWDKKLNKRENEAWRYETLVLWQSISRSEEDGLRRAATRLGKRREES
jgi:hypothetical protein